MPGLIRAWNMTPHEDEAAAELWADEPLRSMAPEEAAQSWLQRASLG